MKLTTFRDRLTLRRHPHARTRTDPEPSGRIAASVDDMSLDARDQALVMVGRVLRAHDYHFTAVTPDTQAIILARADEEAAEDWRDVFGWNRLFERDLLPEALMAALREADAVEVMDDGWLRARIRFSTVGDRIFLHSGFPTTARDAVFFGPDTYRFIRLLRQHLGGGDTLMEIGGGSGAAAIVMADRYATIGMTDINPLAVRFARINAIINGVAADLHAADLLTGVAGPFDAIIANPPYLIDPAARLYRDGGNEGIAVALAMVAAALPRLSADGTFVLYSGAPIVRGRDLLWSALAPVLAECGRTSRYEELDPDVFGGELALPQYAHVERLAVVSLVVGPSGSGPVATTPPSILIKDRS